ncbi:MAG: hypothetical protein ACM31H_00380 [Nitrososphaerales archaeon]
MQSLRSSKEKSSWTNKATPPPLEVFLFANMLLYPGILREPSLSSVALVSVSAMTENR